MAFAGLLALLDDIAGLMGDVAALTKVAAKKTAGVLGDDLALNAEQVTGVRPERELVVVWAVAMGSVRNKAVLVPVALLVSAVLPWAVTPMLMVGGAFLSFEGTEKLAHKVLDAPEEETERRASLATAVANPEVDLVAFERRRIDAAIRTDFILSAEVVVISLGAVATATLTTRVLSLVAISAVMTAGVYGIVAAIVKLDDLGLYLSVRGGARKRLGDALLRLAPLMMKGLSVAGTAAMFLVGGGIITHGFSRVERWGEHVALRARGLGYAGKLLAAVIPSALDAAVGLLVGIVLVALVRLAKRFVPKKPAEAT